MRYITLAIISVMCLLASCSVEGEKDIFDVPYTGYTLFEADFENVDMLENSSEIVAYICGQMEEYHVAITLMRLEENFLKANRELENKLDIINIYPLSFSEFLIVNKENSFCDRIANQAKEPLNKEELDKLEHYMKKNLIKMIKKRNQLLCKLTMY